MTKLWRLSKARYAATAFDGEGSSRFGGRWISKGTAVCYCSATLSLATLEMLVNMAVEDFGRNFVFIQAEVPDGLPVATCSVSQLPDAWRKYPAPLDLAKIGDYWAAAATELLLMVPSAVIPQEHNILINPRHPDFKKIRLYPPEPFVLDPRLLKTT